MLKVCKLQVFAIDYEHVDGTTDNEHLKCECGDIFQDYDSDDISTAKIIFEIIADAWIYGYKTIYSKKHYRPLLIRILKIVSNKQALKFLLPGFPNKNSNREEKVLGINADFAELLALRTLIETARQIEAVYSYGVEITIMVDVTMSDDLYHEICKEHYEVYYNDLKRMIHTVGADDVIKLMITADSATFSGLNDVKENYIRISTHHHHPKTEKFPVDLYKKYDCNKSALRVPWRHTVMFDAMEEKFIIDHKNHLLSSSTKTSPVIVANFNGHPWLLIKICYSQYESTQVLDENDIEVSMIRNGTGIIIENKSGNNLKSSVFHSDCLKSLIKEFGVLILKGFDKFQDENGIADFYSRCGRLGLLQWEFGPLIKSKSDSQEESRESLIHWDLMVPPPYMGISQLLHSYDEYTCRELMMYCHSNFNKKGTTMFVDAHAAIFALDGSKKRKWMNTVLVYGNKSIDKSNQTNGGSLFQYPLIQECPWTQKDVFRWAEMFAKEDADHEQTYIIKTGSETELSPRELELEIKEILLDDRFAFEHTYSENDQVFVNNYTILHSTNGFELDSELWKLHLVPSSNKIPDHYQNL